MLALLCPSPLSNNFASTSGHHSTEINNKGMPGKYSEYQ
jgi:hypothetical protein